MLILDTNVLSEAMRLTPHRAVMAWLDRQPRLETFTTAISEAEVFAGIERMPPGKRRDIYRTAAEEIFLNLSGRVLAFDTVAAREYGLLLGANQAHGRMMSTFDAQIAAIARAHSATLATRNTKDFQHGGVQLVDPWRI